MNKSQNLRLYLIFALFILCILSLPKIVSTTLRGKAANFVMPIWKSSLMVKKWLFHNDITPLELKLNVVELENNLLKQELSRMQDLLHEEVLLQGDLWQLKNLAYDLDKNSFLRRRFDDIQRIVDLKLNAIHAEVIFRGYSNWLHTCRINVGKKTNKEIGREIIKKNSPVVVGSSVVGVIEEVLENSSVVRFITDPGLHPSVRVARGFYQIKDIVGSINIILSSLAIGNLPLKNESDYRTMKENLEYFKQSLASQKEGVCLAKGELNGAKDSYWFSDDITLGGSGFNYDFSDKEGQWRDLRTGKESGSKSTPVALIQVGDLLVTTGMDGVFPAGLNVAEVSKIEVLKEGAYSYDIEAKPIVKNLSQLRYVFVLPALD
jgi:rod shape-determining protein MreC